MTKNKERIQLLVDALRSGEFKQGNGKLTYIEPNGTVRHCCLGVACQVAKRNGLEVIDKMMGLPPGGTDIVEYREDDGMWQSGVLPKHVADWYGIDPNPILKLNDTQNDMRVESATYCNDSLKLSFPEIADLFQDTYLSESE